MGNNPVAIFVIRRLRGRDIRSASCDGRARVFPTRIATSLGRIPKQILQSRRLQVQAIRSAADLAGRNLTCGVAGPFLALLFIPRSLHACAVPAFLRARRVPAAPAFTGWELTPESQ